MGIFIGYPMRHRMQDAMEHLKRVDERLVPVIDHFGATSAAEKVSGPTARRVRSVRFHQR